MLGRGSVETPPWVPTADPQDHSHVALPAGYDAAYWVVWPRETVRGPILVVWPMKLGPRAS